MSSTDFSVYSDPLGSPQEVPTLHNPWTGLEIVLAIVTLGLYILFRPSSPPARSLSRRVEVSEARAPAPLRTQTSSSSSSRSRSRSPERAPAARRPAPAARPKQRHEPKVRPTVAATIAAPKAEPIAQVAAQTMTHENSEKLQYFEGWNRALSKERSYELTRENYDGILSECNTVEADASLHGRDGSVLNALRETRTLLEKKGVVRQDLETAELHLDRIERIMRQYSHGQGVTPEGKRDIDYLRDQVVRFLGSLNTGTRLEVTRSTLTNGTMEDLDTRINSLEVSRKTRTRISGSASTVEGAPAQAKRRGRRRRSRDRKVSKRAPAQRPLPPPETKERATSPAQSPPASPKVTVTTMARPAASSTPADFDEQIRHAKMRTMQPGGEAEVRRIILDLMKYDLSGPQSEALQERVQVFNRRFSEKIT